MSQRSIIAVANLMRATTKGLSMAFAMSVAASAPADTHASADAQARAGATAIRNRHLEVEWIVAEARLAVRIGTRTVATGAFPGGGGTVEVAPAADRTFGAGQALVVSHPDGSADRVLLFPDLPFALFRTVLRNGGPAATTVDRVPTLELGLDLGRPPRELRTLGTGGLGTPIAAPGVGSYLWLAVADPETRRGIVSGWITGERGSGVVFAREDSGEVRLEARIEYGRLRLGAGSSQELETFALGHFEDARLGLEAWADAVARVHDIRLPPQPAGYCTWYSKPHGGASDEKHLADLAAFAAKDLAPFGFSVVQIDDGWQSGISKNGPRRNFTTHAPAGPYPGGMKATADRIRAEGLVAGIWFMPFAGTHYDPFFEGRKDWFVRRESGEPFETEWGGTCLDLTVPDVREYLRSNVRRFKDEWGYRYFKMDGLWTGSGTRLMYVNDAYRDDAIGEGILADPAVTHVQALRSGLRLVREAAGKDVFILGCCAPQNMRSYGAAMGFVDAMRIGPDNGSDWNGLRTGPTFGSRHYFLHGRVWYNDPDPLYVRESVPVEQARLISSWVALTGQMNLSSDWLPGLPAERIDILKRTVPAHGLRPRPVDLFDESIPRIWLLTDERRSPRRDVVGLFNWGEGELLVDEPLARIGLAPEVEHIAFDYWRSEVMPPFRGRLRAAVPARSCRILAVRPALDRPELLSTSRHVTQGMVDVLQEEWDAGRTALRGRSRIVGGDRYELRIVLPTTGPRWRVKSAEASAAPASGGGAEMKVSVAESDGLARVALETPASGEVVWSVTFEG